MSLTIVADDLTGACDTGSLFTGDGPVPLAIWPSIPAPSIRPLLIGLEKSPWTNIAFAN